MSKKLRHRSKAGAWYRAIEAVLWPVLMLVTKRDWRGGERLHVPGGVIVAANHVSWADPLTTAHFVNDQGRPARFLAKAELFGVPVLGRLLKGAGQIPVKRGSTDAARSIKAAAEAVRNGECVIVYPEGTLTRDPQLWPMTAKTGVARLALETGAPVLPMAHWGAQRILPPYSFKLGLFPRKKITALIGPPVDLEDLKGGPITSTVLREATDRIMREVTALLAEIRGEVAPSAPKDRNELLRGSKHDPEKNGNLPKRKDA